MITLYIRKFFDICVEFIFCMIAQSDKYEKLSPENGLLLCLNHDKLFDSGYISFDDNGGILISEKLDMNTKIFMNINGNMKIEVNDDNLEFVRYHRMFVFNKL